MAQYQGKEVEKWQHIQKEINANKVIPVSFRKTPEEKIELANAKQRHKEFVKAHPDYKGIR